MFFSCIEIHANGVLTVAVSSCISTFSSESPRHLEVGREEQSPRAKTLGYLLCWQVSCWPKKKAQHAFPFPGFLGMKIEDQKIADFTGVLFTRFGMVQLKRFKGFWLVTWRIIPGFGYVVNYHRRVVPLPNGHSWPVNGGDPNHLLTGMILQEGAPVNCRMFFMETIPLIGIIVPLPSSDN